MQIGGQQPQCESRDQVDITVPQVPDHPLPAGIPATRDSGLWLRDVTTRDVPIRPEVSRTTSPPTTIQRYQHAVTILVQWYEFVVRDGYAAIRLSDLESNIEVLAEDKQLDLPAGEDFQLTGACVATR